MTETPSQPTTSPASEKGHSRPEIRGTQNAEATRKSAKIMQSPQEEGWSDFLIGVLLVPVTWAKGLLTIFDDLPEKNLGYAADFAREGRYSDAVLRLRLLLWMAPNYQQAWYLLGNCYVNTGEQVKAVHALKKSLEFAPNDIDTIFLLSSIDPKLVPENQRLTSMPDGMARAHFDALGENYDAIQKAAGYRGHVYVDAAVRRYAEQNRVNYTGLDLGCGTGLCGYLLGDVIFDMDGVDFTRSMLDGAMDRRDKQKNRAYKKTFFDDIREFLPNCESDQYDFVFAAHVFNYIGDIDSVLEDMARVVKPGGYVVFQVEPYRAGFGLIAGAGRFGHSDPHIRQRAEALGMEVLENETVAVYSDLRMNQYVWRKAAA